MRKALVILIIIVLLIGVSGCRSVPTVQDELNEAYVLNAATIAIAINTYNMLYPENMLPDNVSLEDAKEALGTSLWPVGLSDGDAKESWKLIIIKDGEASLTPEAQEAWDKL